MKESFEIKTEHIQNHVVKSTFIELKGEAPAMQIKTEIINSGTESAAENEDFILGV